MIIRGARTGHTEQKSSSFVERQKVCQKMLQKMSVIKTNSFDDIKKIVHCGILTHVLF